jgi:hypothetical protein
MDRCLTTCRVSAALPRLRRSMTARRSVSPATLITPVFTIFKPSPRGLAILLRDVHSRCRRRAAGEGLAYVFSFLWKPPILIAWRPREVSFPSLDSQPFP